MEMRVSITGMVRACSLLCLLDSEQLSLIDSLTGNSVVWFPRYCPNRLSEHRLTSQSTRSVAHHEASFYTFYHSTTDLVAPGPPGATLIIRLRGHLARQWRQGASGGRIRLRAGSMLLFRHDLLDYQPLGCWCSSGDCKVDKT